MRKCPVCGTKFTPLVANARFCSAKCRRRSDAERRRKTERAAGRGCSTGTCRCCGSKFDYVSRDGRQRTICDECRAMGYKTTSAVAKDAARKRTVSAPVKKTCLFCGKTFPTRSDAKFCGHCLSAKFDQVYAFRKETSRGNWISEGERKMRQTALR